jgi:hypothetical protein
VRIINVNNKVKTGGNKHQIKTPKILQTKMAISTAADDVIVIVQSAKKTSRKHIKDLRFYCNHSITHELGQ